MNVFSQFELQGKLSLPERDKSFSEQMWHPHASFEGVALKHLVTGDESNGLFSYHLVKIEPNKKIGLHIHEEQLETHEVIDGTGYCIKDKKKIQYNAGTIAIMEKNIPHEVIAGEDGLYLFAKFFPALL